MTDSEYIDLCYERILGRAASKADKLALIVQFKARLTTRETFVTGLLHSAEFESQLASREPYPSGHFFSALASREERARYARDASCESIAGINLRVAEQTALAETFAAYYSQCPLARTQDPTKRYHGDNASFPFSDAYVFYCFIRHYRPRRIIEFGSGFSSAACLDSLDALALDDTQCWFIDPYPALVRSLLGSLDERHSILAALAQEVDLELFESLEAGDILFIDSTHVSKINSDVNRIFFDIMPRLKPGVIIHIHDIYWPFDYPDEWIQEGRAWNEAYLVRAFLQFNDAFEILYFNSFLHPRIRETVFAPPGVDIGANDGGSLWLVRV
ncbi:MAG: class I SAM-dependent methyltransferase [Halioglobus sp.]|nr:class I SAM-dependent methyltransferase [Halioglobus sp.]